MFLHGNVLFKTYEIHCLGIYKAMLSEVRILSRLEVQTYLARGYGEGGFGTVTLTEGSSTISSSKVSANLGVDWGDSDFCWKLYQQVFRCWRYLFTINHISRMEIIEIRM